MGADQLSLRPGNYSPRDWGYRKQPRRKSEPDVGSGGGVMNEKLNFARKMFDLPIVGSGECYPHISYLPQHVTVGEALKLFELGGYHLTRILSPHILANDDCSLFKLRIVFVMERGIAPRIFRNCKREWETEMKQERAFIKGGFLFDTVDHFYEWRNAEG